MVYRPNKGGNQESVYSQHERYLAKNRDKRDPLVALDEDLTKTIQEHQEKGENIILMGDFNNNVRKVRIKKSLYNYNYTKQSSKYMEIIHQQHRKETKKEPR